MDNKFTELIKQWLEASPTDRDYTVGALYVLKLSGNQILCKNLVANIEKRKDVIEYQLQKYYNFRVQALTHHQVEEMAAEVETIAADHLSLAEDAQDFKKGKRADHDSLPFEIQARWQENLPILQRMRELHLKLRALSTENSTCPDSERYPFLKELIKLDKQLHENWDVYDHYVADPTATPSGKKPSAVSKRKTTLAARPRNGSHQPP